MNTNDMQYPTQEEVDRLMAQVPCDPSPRAPLTQEELDEMLRRHDEEQARIRKIYIDSPKRTAFFDYAEVLWYEVLERYGVMLEDEDLWQLIDIWIEDYRRFEILYDAVDEFAEGRGWEMN